MTHAPIQEPSHAADVLLTADNLGLMPDTGTRHDLIDGVLVDMSRPKPRHGRVAARLIRLLGDHVDAQQLGDVFTEAGFVLSRSPDTVCGPDVAFVAATRGLQESDLDKHIDGVPDLAVEIVSPNDNAVELRQLIDLYFAAGARLVWMIYPMFRTIEVYRPDDSVKVLRAKDTLDGEVVLSGFSARVSAIFE